MFSKVFNYVAQVLNIPLPEVFLVEDNKPATCSSRTRSRRTSCSRRSWCGRSCCRARRERELAFLSARRLTFMRPEYYLRCCCRRTPSSRSRFSSAIVLVQPHFPVPPNRRRRSSSTCPRCRSACRRSVHEQLGAVVQRFIQAAPEINLAKWGHAVDAASHRAGFIICGDLEVAARMVIDGAGRRRRAAGEGQDQGARALLDLRGVLRGARADGPDDRRLDARCAGGMAPFDFLG